MEFVTTLLAQQPLMALFLTIAIGYLVGEINIKGFSLGVGAVLFVALFMGWFAPNVGAGADGGDAGSRALPLRRRRAIRQAVLPRTDDRQGAKSEFHRSGWRAAGGSREHPARESDADEHRLWTGPVRGVGDEHADTPGSHRDARQRRSGGRLLGLLSVRRGGTDPAAYVSFMVLKPRIEAPSARVSTCSKSRCAIPSCRARRSATSARCCRPACRSRRCDGRAGTRRPPPAS